MYVTSYGYDDNTPPSAQIAYPKSDGWPTIHNRATEGPGTWDSPITFATDLHEYYPGTRKLAYDLVSFQEININLRCVRPVFEEVLHYGGRLHRV